MLEVFFRYLHFIGIFGVVSTLIVEHLLIKRELSASEIKRIAMVDSIYGISAILVLVAGLSLCFWVGKPSAFYTANILFHIKVTAFIVVGLLSVYPTIFFIRHRNIVEPKRQIPTSIMLLIRAELTILMVIPLLAVLIARGYGLS